MKKLLSVLLLILLFTSSSFSQKKKGIIWKECGTGILIALAGHYDALNEVIDNNPFGYKDKHPNANPTWFDHKHFYSNKYKEIDGVRDPKNGPAFWGSTTIFVYRTDLWHQNNLFRNLSLAGSTGFLISITLGEKIKWWQVAGQVVGSFVCFKIGSTSTLNYYQN